MQRSTQNLSNLNFTTCTDALFSNFTSCPPIVDWDTKHILYDDLDQCIYACPSVSVLQCHAAVSDGINKFAGSSNMSFMWTASFVNEEDTLTEHFQPGVFTLLYPIESCTVCKSQPASEIIAIMKQQSNLSFLSVGVTDPECGLSQIDIVEPIEPEPESDDDLTVPIAVGASGAIVAAGAAYQCRKRRPVEAQL